MHDEPIVSNEDGDIETWRVDGDDLLLIDHTVSPEREYRVPLFVVRSLLEDKP